MRTRPGILAIRTAIDPILGWVAPVGLAAAAGTALVLDLAPGELPYPGGRTVADMLDEGPSRSEMTPDRPGVAIVPGGGVRPVDAVDLVGQIGAGWPAVVLRVGEESPWPLVPVSPALPGHLGIDGGSPAVWQLSMRGEAAPGPGPILPPLSRTIFRSLLRLELPMACAWVRAWRRVWDLPWR
ncbi:MAG TPA: hypothetical protein VID03_05690 [Acidimicrobiia bacterium]